MVALSAVMPRAARGRPLILVLAEAKGEMQKMVEVAREAAKVCGEERREQLEAIAREHHVKAASLVCELRSAIRGCRTLIVERYARNGGRVRIEMSDFPTLTAGQVDVSCPSGTTWGEIATKGVRIPLCHIRSIQVIW